MKEVRKIVLIVDDSISTRAKIRAVLENEGYDVREAGNEAGMIKNICVSGEMADVVLMDLVLNAQNGLDLIANMRSDDWYKNIPVIILTEHATLSYVKEAKDLDVEGYILKPVNIETLKEKIKNLVWRKKV